MEMISLENNWETMAKTLIILLPIGLLRLMGEAGSRVLRSSMMKHENQVAELLGSGSRHLLREPTR